MADNVEKFLIDFVFKDKKALTQIKEFVDQYDRLNKKVKENARKSRQASSEKVSGIKKETRALDRQNRAQSKQNTLEQRRLELRKRIAHAESLGMKVSGYKTTATSSQKADHIRARIIELNNRIFDQEQRIKAEKAKQAQQSAKQTQSAAKRVQLNEQAARLQKSLANSQARMTRAYDRRSKLERDIELAKGRVRRSQNFQAIAGTPVAGKALQDLEMGMRTGGKLGAQYINRARDSLQQYGREALRAKKRTMGLRTAQQGLADSTRHMIRSYASLFAVFAATNSINRVGQGFEAMESAMLAAMGSQKEAADNIQFLDEMTSRLGLSLLDTADQYTKFVFASKGKLDTDQVNEFFTSVAEAGTVLGVSKERMKLSFNALQQMLNKTTVNSEELKRQLAESFPGAIQIFARAMGKSEEELFKMMEQGQVIAAEVFPDVAKEMKKVANAAGALEAKYKTTRVAQGRFFKELEKAQNTIFKGGFDEALAELLNFMAKSFKENQAALTSFGKVFGLFFTLLNSAVRMLTPPIMALSNVVGTLAGHLDAVFGTGSGQIVAGIGAITLAAKGLGKVFTRQLAVITAVVFAIEELIALTTEGLVGNVEYSIGKDLSLPDINNMLDGKKSLLPDKILGMPTAFGLGKKALESIKQIITVEVPAGANAEYFKDITKSAVDEANQSLINNSYVGGE